MKRLILLIGMILFVSVSSAQFFDYTKNQRRTLKHFHSKKRMNRSFKGVLSHKYVPAKKRGYIVNRTVNRGTRRKLVADIKY